MVKLSKRRIKNKAKLSKKLRKYRIRGGGPDSPNTIMEKLRRQHAAIINSTAPKPSSPNTIMEKLRGQYAAMINSTAHKPSSIAVSMKPSPPIEDLPMNQRVKTASCSSSCDCRRRRLEINRRIKKATDEHNATIKHWQTDPRMEYSIKNQKRLYDRMMKRLQEDLDVLC